MVCLKNKRGIFTSVPPDVNIISEGLEFIKSARKHRDSCISFLASFPL
jgi:hypothetical protein